MPFNQKPLPEIPSSNTEKRGVKIIVKLVSAILLFFLLFFMMNNIVKKEVILLIDEKNIQPEKWFFIVTLKPRDSLVDIK